MIQLFQEFISLLTPINLLVVSFSSVLGMLIGCLPGLTATMGIALLTGITYGMHQDVAILMLMGIYVGAMFGGSIASILIGIPGTGSAAATVMDGHPLAKQGKGGTALTLALLGSFVGTLFGMLLLSACTPFLQKISLKFTSAEIALLAFFGVTICGSLTGPGGSPMKGLIGGVFGLLISCIGMETMYGYARYTFGNTQLLGGIAFVPAMIGLFGIPSVLNELSNLKTRQASEAIQYRKEDQEKIGIIGLLKKHLFGILRAGAIGTGIGCIPGVGEDVAAWMAYDTAKKASKTPEKFGRGAYEGVLAAETANNACVGGALIPLLCLAIPGSAPTAVLLGALRLHGIRPGPMLTFEFPNFIAYMSAVLLLCSLIMRIFGYLACKVAPKVLKIPPYILMPIVAVLSIIGSYALNIRSFDLVVMFVFGILGYFFMKQDYPAAPIILGLILGPMLDENFRRSLQTSGGSMAPFVTRPIALVILVLILWSILGQFPAFKRLTAKLSFKKKNA